MNGLILMVVLAGILAPSMDLPAFRQGLWKYTRTVSGKPIETTKCSNPTDDMKRQNAMLEKAGCTFSPVRQSGNTYTFESKCSMRGMSSQTTTVMTVESDSAYRLNVTGTTDGAPTNETLVARRIGECGR